MRPRPVPRFVPTLRLSVSVNWRISDSLWSTQDSLRSAHHSTAPGRIRRTGCAHVSEWCRGPNDLVFPAPSGGPVSLNLWRRRFWRPAVIGAGLTPLRPHDLRHTAVALWIAAGANPFEVKTRAGVKSAAFILDRYGHLFPGSEDRVNDALDALAATASGRAHGAPKAAQKEDEQVDKPPLTLIVVSGRRGVGAGGLEPSTSAV